MIKVDYATLDHMEQGYGLLVSKSISRVLDSPALSVRDKQRSVFILFTAVLEDVTEAERLVFTTLFSRLAYVGGKYRIKSEDLHLLHVYRRANEKLHYKDKPEAYLELGCYATEVLVSYVDQAAGRPSMPDAIVDIFAKDQREVVSFRPVIRGLIVSIDEAQTEVSFIDEADASQIRKVRFDRADKNENFASNITSIAKHMKMPVHANLIDVEVDAEDQWVPQALVVLPDYLKDVTSVAECFTDYGTETMLSLIGRYTGPEPTSKPILVGNVANMLLDELVANDSINFKELIPKIFQFNPVAISLYNDDDIREVIAKSKIHYENIKRVLREEAPALGFDRSMIYLEPSFFSRDYGLQGRLDMFHHNAKKRKLDIVELKSGSPYKANVYGLSASHYIQTLLYDLLVKSTFGRKSKPSNYILYSKLAGKSLKYAPSAKAQQYEAMQVRNELMILEYISAYQPEKLRSGLSYIKAANFPQVKGFKQTDIIAFEKLFAKVGKLLQDYLIEFTSFIKREQFLSKTGVHGLENSNGLAAIWLENSEEKEDRFALLKQLEIAENNSEGDIPTLTLTHSSYTSELANFREGDIAVLYPYADVPEAVMHNQVFKCSIVSRASDQVVVKLRSKQYNHSIFRKYTYWNIEEDKLDSSFNKGLRSIYSFLHADKYKQQVLLGLTPSQQNRKVPAPPRYELLTKEQHELLTEMCSATDYYLLWGPPGTGKTSIMIRSYVQYLLGNTEQNIMLLAYTNRAVDEMCAAIESIGDGYRENYIRIGSHTASNPAYRSRILEKYIANASSREEIRQKIQDVRIVVGTVSSVANKPELFLLKSFETAIVDEASQILEPNIIDLLSRVDKFVLVGDHKQLPAVVQQDAHSRAVSSTHLQEIGITDMSMSLFERLYRQCLTKGWQHSYGILKKQGRMHRDIVNVASELFYESKLGVLESIPRLTAQHWAVVERQMDLPRERLVYISTSKDESLNHKTNREESDVVSTLIKRYQLAFAETYGHVDAEDIGVITPYRAQIAMIKNTCRQAEVDIEKITIDTVERYQGGARNVIIISLCLNKEKQFKSLVSMSTEGVDRKLNVALTRAKEQIILIGCEEVIRKNETYAELIDRCARWSLADP